LRGRCEAECDGCHNLRATLEPSIRPTEALGVSI
jgi:hypothetical protein